MKIPHKNTGKKRSKETLEKMRISHLGQPCFWKGKKRPPHTEESKRKMSEAKRGKVVKEETKQKMSQIAKARGFGRWSKGKKLSEETKQKMSASRQGEKSHRWKGGIYPEHRRLRQTREYKLWRESVFKRDNYTCIWCGQRGGTLNADHIKRFSDYPELRFAIDNGRTLCIPCHKTTETWGNKKQTTDATLV